MTVASNNRPKRRKACFLVLLALLLSPGRILAKDNRCPGVDDPPPPILTIDREGLIRSLESLKDEEGRAVWKTTDETIQAIDDIFESTPRKTKLEQFFQLLSLIQRQLPRERNQVVVHPPSITRVLLAAKVFTDPSFPKKITAVSLTNDGSKSSPLYRVEFSSDEVRFPINGGKGFASWEQGMCQSAKELVFYPRFSFRLRTARNSKNLIVDDFDKVQIFGQFGTRGLFDIDLAYVDLEKVEFIAGTDQGKVTARVAKREFKENPHSGLFRLIGRLIPNTARQRIDW